VNLSRPDRRERLERLAAEFALGTSPPRVRRRLTAIARRDRIVAAALAEWERRIASLASAVPGIAPPPRVWHGVVARLGLGPETPARPPWWQRLGLWRTAAALGFAAAATLGVLEWERAREPMTPPIVVVLAGADAKPALIATAARADRHLTLKAIGNAAPSAGRVFELWALPQTGPPKSLGVVPPGPLAQVPLALPAGEALSNIPSLAVSLEPPGGSPTGQPTGPVVYSGSVERMY